MQKISLTISLVGLLFIAGFADALAQIQQHEDGTRTWQAGVDGIEIEWGSDGQIERLYSRYGHPVNFPDRRGIRTAQIIAEERAKANIIRFIQQDLTDARFVTDLNNEIESASRIESGAGSVTASTTERTMSQSLRQVTASASAGTLRGVVVLEQGYDEASGEAWVVAGISRRTIQAASGVADFLSGESSPRANSESNGSSREGAQPSERRRSNQQDW